MEEDEDISQMRPSPFINKEQAEAFLKTKGLPPSKTIHEWCIEYGLIKEVKIGTAV